MSRTSTAPKASPSTLVPIVPTAVAGAEIVADAVVVADVIVAADADAVLAVVEARAAVEIAGKARGKVAGDREQQSSDPSPKH
jgi:hypothetical protein